MEPTRVHLLCHSTLIGEELPSWLWVDGTVLVGVYGERPSACPPDAVVHEGGIVAPPLTDAHVHLALDGDFDPAARAAVAGLGREEALARVLGLLERYLATGVVRVRDGGDPSGAVAEAARVAERSPDRYARVSHCGRVIRREGRYGKFLGEGITSLREAFRVIEGNAASGARHTKILATGLNSLEESGRVGESQFSGMELRELAAASRANGLKVMVHANGALRELLSARPDSVEHGFWMEDDDLLRLRDAGTVWVPTMGAWAELENSPGLTGAQREVVRDTAARQSKMVARAAGLGVRVALGSDAGTPGVSHPAGAGKEIRRLCEAAGSPGFVDEVLKTGLALAGMDGEWLVAGERAGFLILPGERPVDAFTRHQPLGVISGSGYLGAIQYPAGC